MNLFENINESVDLHGENLRCLQELFMYKKHGLIHNECTSTIDNNHRTITVYECKLKLIGKIVLQREIMSFYLI